MGIIRVPITKAGKSAFLEVNTDDPEQGGDFNAEMYQEALALGVKLMLNRKMTKITTAKLTGVELEKAQAAAMEQAKANLADIRAGSMRKTAAKTAKVSGAVNTEAMRLARNLVRDTMKREGIKVSYVEASAITAAAKTLLETNPALIEQAKAAIAARDAQITAVGEGLVQITKSIPISEKKKAKAEKDAAEKKANAPLSAKQASKPKIRAKGQPQATAH